MIATHYGWTALNGHLMPSKPDLNAPLEPCTFFPSALGRVGWGWEEASSLAEAPLKMYPGSSSANQVAKNTTTAKAEIFAEKTEFPATPTPSIPMGEILT